MTIDTNALLNGLLMTAATGIVAWVGWSFKKWIEQLILERTQPIQKTANGGYSLPDAIRLMQNVDSKIDQVHGRITDLSTDVAHLTGRFDEHIRSGEKNA